MDIRSLRLVRSAAAGAAVFVLMVSIHARKVAGFAHDEMGGHMTMTALRPPQPGDKERAATILAGARKAADEYTDYRKALADGYEIFHPEFKQNVYHFTNNAKAFERTLYFDPAKPTSLLYMRVPAKGGAEPGYKLVGVMYTAPYQVSEDELDRRVPLSVGRWHLHTNLCLPPTGGTEGAVQSGGKFGLGGSITTASACQAAGGRFLPHLFGWMVHVYPYEKDPAKIWAAGMDDDHGMQHDKMPAGMDMPM